jgi:hypothetical protein
MSQQDLTRHTFWQILSYGTLAALSASLIAGAVRLFTFGALFGEPCDDFCDLPIKLVAVPFLGVLTTAFVVPVIFAVGCTCTLYIWTLGNYGEAATPPRHFSLLPAALLVLYGLIWFFPILQLGNPIQTPENTLQWALIAVLTGLLFLLAKPI